MIIIFDDTFIDRHKYHDVSYLNENKYIVPGLGDAGDRLYGTK